MKATDRYIDFRQGTGAKVEQSAKTKIDHEDKSKVAPPKIRETLKAFSIEIS